MDLTRAFFGTIDGSPVCKIVHDNDDVPWEVPNADYHKFVFNSETSNLGYAYDVHQYTWDRQTWTGGSNSYYLPPGSDSSNCEVVSHSRLPGGVATLRNQCFIPLFSRISDLSYPSYWLELPNAEEYTQTWETRLYPYGDGSGDHRYISYNPWHLRLVYGVPCTFSSTSYGKISLPGFTGPELVSNNIRYSNPGGNPYFHYMFEPLGYMASFNTANPSIYPNEDKRFVNLELPIDDAPYPAVSPGFPGDDLLIFQATPTWVGMSKPGYVASPTTPYAAMIFSSEKIPLKVVRCGSVTLAASSQTEVPIDYPISDWTFVDYQINVTGEPLRIPPLPSNESSEITVDYRVDTDNNSVWFRNQSGVSVDIRFFVLSENGDTTFPPNSKVIEFSEDHLVIRSPATSEPIIDSRTQTLPIVAQGWVPVGDMTASDVTRWGNVMHTVNLTNTGFKLYVLAMATFDYLKPAGGGYPESSSRTYIPLNSKKVEGQSVYTRTTFMCDVNSSHDRVKFYAYNGAAPARAEDKGWGAITNLVGFRYYIFAVPASL